MRIEGGERMCEGVGVVYMLFDPQYYICFQTFTILKQQIWR